MTVITALVLAALTAFATACAAAAAIWGPKRSARFAISLQQEKELRDRKFQVFMILMAHRKNYGQSLAMQHLNVIDLLWIDSRSVRDAWAEFYQSIASEGYSITQKEERFRRILSTMSHDLGMGSLLTSDDFQRAYYSTAVGLREEAEAVQAQSIINEANDRLKANQPSDLASVAATD